MQRVGGSQRNGKPYHSWPQEEDNSLMAASTTCCCCIFWLYWYSFCATYFCIQSESIIQLPRGHSLEQTLVTKRLRLKPVCRAAYCLLLSVLSIMTRKYEYLLFFGLVAGNQRRQNMPKVSAHQFCDFGYMDVEEGCFSCRSQRNKLLSWLVSSFNVNLMVDSSFLGD